MTPALRLVMALVVTSTLVTAARAAAAAGGPAAKSLDRCQAALRSEGVKYVQSTQKAIATCLGRIAGEVLKKNAASVAAAVGACTTQFDKIGRTDGRSIGDRFTDKVSAKCAPAPANAHTLDDLLGSGAPGVVEPLGAGTTLGTWCAAYGGDGSVDSLAEWLDCARAAQDCSAYGAITAGFPRALEWLDALAAAMPPSPARDAVVAAETAIDGPTDDGVPGLQCGVACGPDVDAASCDLPDSCAAALRERAPHVVIADLHAAAAAGDWPAVACNYAPEAFRMWDQGVEVGPAEITASLKGLYDLLDGSLPVVTEDLVFRDAVRLLFTIDAGWFEIEDGVATYVVRRGKIRRESWHGRITFTGPPPED